MYLTRGQPVVYYGDEQGFVGAGTLNGTDKDARQSMFATQVAEYANQKLLDGTTAGSVDRYDTGSALYGHIAELAALRAAEQALPDGAQIERYANGAVYAFSRVDATEKIEHLVAMNNGTSPATVTLDTLTPGATFAPLYGTSTSVTAAADGTVSVTIPALGAIVLKAGTTVGAPATAGHDQPQRPGRRCRLSGLVPVTADVADDVWSQTSFAYRVLGDTRWTPLGTSETTSPRVFHDVTGLPAGALVEYRAVTVDAAGHSVRRVHVRERRQRRRRRRAADRPGRPARRPCPAATTARWAARATGSRTAPRPCSPSAPTASTSGTFTLPAGDYEYKVAINGSWDENYGAGGVAGGGNVAYTARRGRTGDVLLRPGDPLLHVDRAGPDPHGPGLGQQRARLRGRLGAGLPDDLAAGPRRRRHLHVRRPRPARRRLRGQGGAQPVLGRELRRRRRARAARTSRSPRPAASP